MFGPLQGQMIKYYERFNFQFSLLVCNPITTIWNMSESGLLLSELKLKTLTLKSILFQLVTKGNIFVKVLN